MTDPAIALIETNSIAAGILAGDAMVKKAVVQLLEARSICPGKYMVLIGGDVGPVRESYSGTDERVAATWRRGPGHHRDGYGCRLYRGR
jgi:microcompartment protein CcmL/EutN